MFNFPQSPEYTSDVFYKPIMKETHGTLAVKIEKSETDLSDAQI